MDDKQPIAAVPHTSAVGDESAEQASAAKRTNKRKGEQFSRILSVQVNDSASRDAKVDTGQRLFIHPSILGKRSRFFKCLDAASTSEPSKVDEKELVTDIAVDCPGGNDVFSVFVEFLYSGELSLQLNPRRCVQLFYLAFKYEVDQLMTMLEDWWRASCLQPTPKIVDAPMTGPPPPVPVPAGAPAAPVVHPNPAAVYQAQLAQHAQQIAAANALHAQLVAQAIAQGAAPPGPPVLPLAPAPPVSPPPSKSIDTMNPRLLEFIRELYSSPMCEQVFVQAEVEDDLVADFDVRSTPTFANACHLHLANQLIANVNQEHLLQSTQGYEAFLQLFSTLNAHMPNSHSFLAFMRTLEAYELVLATEVDSKDSLPTVRKHHNHPETHPPSKLSPMTAEARKFVSKIHSLDGRVSGCDSCYPLSVASALAAAYIGNALRISKGYEPRTDIASVAGFVSPKMRLAASLDLLSILRSSLGGVFSEPPLEGLIVFTPVAASSSTAAVSGASAARAPVHLNRLCSEGFTVRPNLESLLTVRDKKDSSGRDTKEQDLKRDEKECGFSSGVPPEIDCLFDLNSLDAEYDSNQFGRIANSQTAKGPILLGVSRVVAEIIAASVPTPTTKKSEAASDLCLDELAAYLKAEKAPIDLILFFGQLNAHAPLITGAKSVPSASERWFPRGPPNAGSSTSIDRDAKDPPAAAAAADSYAPANASSNRSDESTVLDSARYQEICMILLRRTLSRRMLIHTVKAADTYLYLLLRLIDWRLFLTHDDSFNALRAHAKAIESRLTGCDANPLPLQTEGRNRLIAIQRVIKHALTLHVKVSLSTIRAAMNETQTDVSRDTLMSFLLSDERERAALQAELSALEKQKLNTELSAIEKSSNKSGYRVGMVIDVSDVEHCMSHGCSSLECSQQACAAVVSGAGNWCPAEILQLRTEPDNTTSILIKYIGWSSRFNIWLNTRRNHDRIALVGTFTPKAYLYKPLFPAPAIANPVAPAGRTRCCCLSHCAIQ